VLLALERYSLTDHVLSDEVSAVPAWRRMDAIIRSWLFGTLTAELQETVRVRDDTARITWLRLDQHFRGNHETRALHLDADFRIFEQGDLSITDYCRKMLSMADDLSDLGEVVHDRTLILNMLLGLDEKYSYIVPPQVSQVHPIGPYLTGLASPPLGSSCGFGLAGSTSLGSSCGPWTIPIAPSIFTGASCGSGPDIR